MSLLFQPVTIVRTFHRHTKLLGVRLEAAVEGLIESQASHGSALACDWELFREFDKAATLEALKQPSLHRWVTTVEALIFHGIVESYPAAHPRRQAAAFSRLVVSGLGANTADCKGWIESKGDCIVPLSFGRLLLVGKRAFGVGERFAWETRGGVFKLKTDRGGLIAEVALRTLEAAVKAESGWAVMMPGDVGGIVICPDLRDFDIKRAQKEAARVKSELQAILDGMDAPSRELLSCSFRSATSAQGTWTAGLLRMTTPLTQEFVLRCAYRDRVERAIEIWRFTKGIDSWPGSMEPDVFTQVAAKSLTERHFNEMSLELSPRHTQWSACHESNSTRETDRLLAVIEGDDIDGSKAEISINLAPLLILAGFDPKERCLSLRKTRRNSFAIEDWSALDSLTLWDGSEVRRLLMAVRHGDVTEAGYFCAAICAYRLGEFTNAMQQLRCCLEMDTDVEEYWLLLAFTLRHLGRKDIFEHIVFDHVRSLAQLAAAVGAQEAEK